MLFQEFYPPFYNKKFTRLFLNSKWDDWRYEELYYGSHDISDKFHISSDVFEVVGGYIKAFREGHLIFVYTYLTALQELEFGKLYILNYSIDGFSPAGGLMLNSTSSSEENGAFSIPANIYVTQNMFKLTPVTRGFGQGNGIPLMGLIYVT